MLTLRNSLLLLLLLAHMLFGDPTNALANSRGVQFIGLSRATVPMDQGEEAAEDITILANILTKTNKGGTFEVSCLPFEFNPSNPFGALTELIQKAVPTMQGQLRITLYLRWFPHDEKGDNAQHDFWAAWRASRPMPSQLSTREKYMERVRNANDFVIRVSTWAISNGLGQKIAFTIVPVLEDKCGSEVAFANCLAAIRQQQTFAGVRTDLRRSCLPKPQAAEFRVAGVAMELHGRWEEVQRRLRPGDTWSNDGTDYETQEFIDAQQAALARQVRVLFWRGSYNGYPRGEQFKRNWANRTVNPFTAEGGRDERRDLRRVLSE